MARGLCATCYKKQGVKAKGWSRGNLKAQAERFKAKFPDYGSQWMAQRLKRRSFIQQMKSGPCADCGQVFPPEVMDFDHVGPKRFNISSGVRAKGIVALREELAQCQVVCAVCHRIRTARRRLERTVAVPV